MRRLSSSLVRYLDALAITRGFAYWTAEYPVPGSELVVLGFTNTTGVSAHQVLGDDYVKARNLDGGMETTVHNAPPCDRHLPQSAPGAR